MFCAGTKNELSFYFALRPCESRGETQRKQVSQDGKPICDVIS
jgi:hypothetical protein